MRGKSIRFFSYAYSTKRGRRGREHTHTQTSQLPATLWFPGTRVQHQNNNIVLATFISKHSLANTQAMTFSFLLVNPGNNLN